MERLLDGKVIIITGAGAGIGRGTAVFFAQEGARVVLVGRTPKTLEETREEVAAIGGTALVVRADVSVSADCKRMVEETVQAFGRLDCAVNNAAIDPMPVLLADYDEDHFDQIIAINLKGIWNCMKYEIPAMIAAGGGSIVNTSSSAAQPAMERMGPYVAAKYGLDGLTKTAAYEYGPQNVRVNILGVGPIDTAMLFDYFPKVFNLDPSGCANTNEVVKKYPAETEPFMKRVPMRRFGLVRECAEAAAWLCSDRASYTTGTNLFVCGGHSVRGAGTM